MIEPMYMVFDVESVGLHGEGFAVGYVVIEGGHELDSGFFRCSPDMARGLSADREWIRENVEPALKEHVSAKWSDGLGCKSPKDVRRSFWDKWMQWKDNKTILCADVAWPVEARFLAACIDDHPTGHAWHGPYPLLDIASVMMAHGLDPLAERERLERELPAHHPLADARQSARLLCEALEMNSAHD